MSNVEQIPPLFETVKVYDSFDRAGVTVCLFVRSMCCPPLNEPLCIVDIYGWTSIDIGDHNFVSGEWYFITSESVIIDLLSLVDL
jgi:hypothetical protein